jgi:hypothetical protein
MYQKISTHLFGGSKNDQLWLGPGQCPKANYILQKLRKTLPVESSLWQQKNTKGRRRITLGKRGTGLIGGKPGITLSVPWEGKKWSWLRKFVTQRTRELISMGILPEDVEPNALINMYPNGTSDIPYHHDRTDNCLGTVASFTFGETEMVRNFLIRNVSTGNEFSVALRHGDMLIMAGDLNTNYQHAVEALPKNDPLWSHYRYNISLRFIIPIQPRKIKTNVIKFHKENYGYRFMGMPDDHPLRNMKAIQVDDVPYQRGYWIRFKSWGKVGATVTHNRTVISMAREKNNKKVQGVPDFYFLIPDSRKHQLVINALNEIQPYFSWRFPTGSRFKDRKIEFGETVDLLFAITSGKPHRFVVPDNYREGIQSISITLKKKKAKKKTRAKKLVEKRFGFIISERIAITPQSPPEKKGIKWAKACRIENDGSLKNWSDAVNCDIPGLNMQYPYSRMLFGGTDAYPNVLHKTVETRTWTLNPKLLHQPIAIIETPGKIGKKNGVNKAQIIGVVRFSEIIQYDNQTQWESDVDRHQCQFKFDGSE